MPALNRPSSGPADDLHATFRPRRGRRLAIILGIAAFVLFTGMSVLASSSAGFRAFDRFGIFAVGSGIAFMLWRFARLAVFVDERGLTVRNLAGDHRYEWAEIVTVRFGGGNPWVTLDLADAETLPAMAIQRADGPFGESEAQRLATLVALHSPTERNT